MNDAEVVDRLTRTYSAVAASTPVSTPDVGELPPTAVVQRLNTRSNRRPLVWATGGIAAAALLLAFLVSVPRRGPQADSVEHLATRMRHATLGLVPNGFGLTSIETSTVADVLRFSDGTRELRVATDRNMNPTEMPQPIGQLDVRAHAAALSVHTAANGSTEIGRSIEWFERTDVHVRILGTGTWETKDLLDIAEKVMMVSDTAWTKLIRNHGFTKANADTDDHAIFDPRFPDNGPQPLGRALDGSLQTGVGMRFGCCFGGIGLIGSPSTNYVSNMGGPDLYLVVGTARVGSVRIWLHGKVLATVAPVADPGIPTLKYASVALPEAIRHQGATAEFLDASGGAIETKAVL